MNQENEVIDLIKENLKEYTFALIGANAVNLWVDDSKIRATQDLDFFIDASEDDFVTIAKKFRDLGFDAHLRFGKKEDPVPLILHLKSEKFPNIDILLASKPWEKELLKTSVKLIDFNMQTSDLNHLVLTKLYSASEVDLIDIKNLILFSVEEVDIEKIKLLIQKYFDENKLNLFLDLLKKNGI